MNTIPTRIAIGTQKAASTYVYNLLLSHSDVSLSEHTEVNFYSSNFEKGVDWYIDSYKKEGTTIDISPKYFMSGKVVAPRIKETLGDTRPKFLLILRNPIDYLNSHFSMQQQQGFFERSPDYDNPSHNLVSFIAQYPKYAERAKYHDMLEHNWLSHFPLSDFKIVFFEELTGPATSDKVLESIQAFWDLEPHTLTAPTTSKNRALRSSFLHKMKTKVIRRPQLKEYLKHQSWFQFIYQNYLTVRSGDSLTAEDRTILSQIYADDVSALETLIGRKVPWKDFT